MRENLCKRKAHECYRHEIRPERMRAEQSVKSLRKAEDVAQPGQVIPVLVAAFICMRWRADKTSGKGDTDASGESACTNIGNGRVKWSRVILWTRCERHERVIWCFGAKSSELPQTAGSRRRLYVHPKLEAGEPNQYGSR
jgi:hypothetical protein